VQSKKEKKKKIEW